MVMWKSKTIGEFASVVSGGTPSTLCPEYWNGSIPWMNSGELNKKRVKSVAGRITETGLNNSSTTLVPEFCVLIGLAGQGKTRGTVAVNYFPLCTNQSIAAILPNPEEYNTEYLYQNLDSRYDELRELSTGDGGRGGLNLTIIRNLSVPLPSLPEQHAIAEALSDADGYIASLEKLIARKKAIKQGAMQELLTGKRRLPGFEGEWVERTLEDIALDIRTGKKNNDDKVSGAKYPFYVRSQQIEQISSYAYDGEAILIPGEGNIGEIFHYIVGKFDWHQRVYKISDFIDEVNGKYVYYYFTMFFGKYALMNTVKATVDSLRLPTFQNFSVLLPSTKQEQSAIAAVLSGMDSEIETLTAKLNKTKLIKLGMMQELLTGRIRLAQPEVAAAVTTQPKVWVATATPSSTQKGHNQQFDDAVMIAGIVNAFHSDRYPLGRKKVQKLLYLLRRKQDESTIVFKKKAAGPYADEVRYRGGEPIAKSNRYIATTTTKGKGTTFVQGKNVGQALDYIERWGRQKDIAWLADKFRYISVDDLELLATVDMAICDLEEAGTTVSVASIKHLIATNKEWQAKLQKKTFADSKIAKAISDLQMLL